MIDPIGNFNKLKDELYRYIETAFSIKSPSVEKERKQKLYEIGALAQEPWIEPMPIYSSNGKAIDDLSSNDLPNMGEHEINLFKGAVKNGLFPANINLYTHQYDMLKSALQGNNCVITTSTGSGKTEAFLLPTIAKILTEAAKWKEPDIASSENSHADDWYENRSWKKECIANKKSWRVTKRKNEKRPSGIRAIIMYPMNALVEDQLTRLRKSLDSIGMREWLRENLSGNQIYFGRYNGQTPVPGYEMEYSHNGRLKPNTEKIEKLAESIKEIKEHINNANKYLNSPNNSSDDDIKYFYPQIDGAEMSNRWDMQDNPPDILITNFSMLSIMLMREVESGIFEQTRNWLECKDLAEDKRNDEKNNRVFHLIIDELHLLRGTSGTEISYLIKLLLLRLGLTIDSPQLRILASSASMKNNEESREFLDDFFGSGAHMKIIDGEYEVDEEYVNQFDIKLFNAFKYIAETYNEKPIDKRSNDEILLDAYLKATGKQASKPEDFLDYLNNSEIKKFISKIFYSNHEKTQALPFSKLAEGIKNYRKEFYQIDADSLLNAAQGFTIARGLFDEYPIESKLPAFRIHYFFKNVDGLWASTGITTGIGNERTVGELYTSPKIMSTPIIKKETITAINDSLYRELIEKGYINESGAITEKVNINNEFSDIDPKFEVYKQQIREALNYELSNSSRILDLLYCEQCGTLLYGGMRKDIGNNAIEMLLNTANLEGVPDLVQNNTIASKSYDDYAVFWPMGGQGEKFTNNMDNHWIKATLDTRNGAVELEHSKGAGKVKGYLYKNLKKDNSSLPYTALPVICPNCGTDYTRRKNYKSPIRSFKTGLYKINQVLAKNLLYYSLNTNEDIHALRSGNKSNKLVVFSDSRQDAAQIANGIERDHYKDLLRKVILKELTDNAFGLPELLKNISDGTKYSSNAQLYLDSHKGADKKITLLIKRSKSGDKETFPKEINDAINEISSIEFAGKTRTVSISGLLPDGNSIGYIAKKLLELGVNPIGVDIGDQNLLGEKTKKYWTNFFDFDNLECNVEGNKIGLATSTGKIYENLKKSMIDFLFFRLYYSFESSGLGRVTLKSQDLPSNLTVNGEIKIPLRELAESIIRILGDTFYFTNEKGIITYDNFPTKIKHYLGKVAEKYNVNKEDIGEALLSSLVGLGYGLDGLDISKLSVIVSEKNDKVWTCPNCNRHHLQHSLGICTNCFHDLPFETDQSCESLLKSNY